MGDSRRHPWSAFAVYAATAVVLLARVVGAQPQFEVLHSFRGVSAPHRPSGLLLASDRNWYGTTLGGGDHVKGTIFKIDPEGVLTLLHSFAGGTEGSEPWARLIEAGDGKFYGTTARGGPADAGTVFSITSDGTFRTVHTFAGADGRNPYARLVQGSDGNLYGTTAFGGAFGWGGVFTVTPGGDFSLLHSFTYPDGLEPMSALIEGADGWFYGTTFSGGMRGFGTVYKISSAGEFVSFHSFAGGRSGGNPTSGVVQGPDGVLYGSTANGGLGWGTLYWLSPTGVLVTLHEFTASEGQVSSTDAPLILGADGHLYGECDGGGDLSQGTGGLGTIFRLAADGSFTVLLAYPWPGLDGAHPSGGLSWTIDGELAGTTREGGGGGAGGTVFTLSTSGTLTVRYRFATDLDGAFPIGALTRGVDGRVFGSTTAGGVYGQGTVFELRPDAKVTTFYSYPLGSGTKDAGLTMGTDGNLYGVSGASGERIFELSPSGDMETLHDLTPDEGYAARLPLQAEDGLFYVTTAAGGAFNGGTAVRISPEGMSTVLQAFSEEIGRGPSALIQGADGFLYGVTSAGGTAGKGVLFRIDAGGAAHVLHTFRGLTYDTPCYDCAPIASGDPTDGATPVGSLVQAPDGTLYGMTMQGGALGGGTIYKVLPQGSGFALLHSFDRADNFRSKGPLAFGSDGVLYGASDVGGPAHCGEVFRISTTGVYRVIWSFTCGADGANPQALLWAGGQLYGTAMSGGAFEGGTIFRLSFPPRVTFSATADGGVMKLPPVGLAAGRNVLWTASASPPAPIICETTFLGRLL